MDSHTRPLWAERLHKLRLSLAAQDLDCFVVSTPLNIKYLTGFSGSTALLVVRRDAVFLVTDGRYTFAVQEGLSSGTLAPIRLERVQQRYDVTLAALLEREGARRAGFEAGHVTVATLGGWQRAAPGVAWVPTERMVEAVRAVKDAGEIAILRRGGRLIASVAEQLHCIVGIGRAERDIASDLDAMLIAAGFSGPAFPTIVASGPNTALPHARPTDRRVASGDLVLLDFGGVLDGYCVDLTRMAAAGSVSAEALALYDAVRAAHGAALAAVRPGIDGSAIDAAARDVLDARGLGEAFMHSTGHGLGLEVHEGPRIARPVPDVAEPIGTGMVFTIEPGAYVEHLGGVRLEDDVLVTTDGGEVLTASSLDLMVV